MNKGVTLVEAMIVIAILGILAAVSLSALPQMKFQPDYQHQKKGNCK